MSAEKEAEIKKDLGEQKKRRMYDAKRGERRLRGEDGGTKDRKDIIKMEMEGGERKEGRWTKEQRKEAKLKSG